MKNYTDVFYVFLKIQKHDFLRLLSCCTRFLEHCHELMFHVYNYSATKTFLLKS